MARAYLAAATTRSPRSVAARAGRVAGWNGEDRRVTGPPGALADFVAAGTPEPVVRYRSVMMNPASTGDAYSAGAPCPPVTFRRGHPSVAIADQARSHGSGCYQVGAHDPVAGRQAGWCWADRGSAGQGIRFCMPSAVKPRRQACG